MFPFNVGLIHSYSTPGDSPSSQANFFPQCSSLDAAFFAPSLTKKQVWVATLLAALPDCTNHLGTEALCETKLLNILNKSSRITLFAVCYFQETDN